MRRVLRHLLIAFALLFAQQAAQLHDLTHAVRDLAAAARGDKSPPPLGHSAEQCLAFHAVGSALTCAHPVLEVQRAAAEAISGVALPIAAAPRVAYDTRAPPSLS
jgi:hypothetical protein